MSLLSLTRSMWSNAEAWVEGGVVGGEGGDLAWSFR